MVLARRRPLRALAALAAVLAATGTAVGASTDGPTGNTSLSPPERGPSWSLADTPERVTLISDSAIAGIRWSGALAHLQNTNWDARLESCRRLVRSSCRGREGYAPPTVVVEIQRIVAERGRPGPNDVLIVATGYNDWHGTFLSDFTAVMLQTRAAGFERVGWLTYRADNGYTAPGTSTNRVDYAQMNAIVRGQAASGSWPELTLLEYDDAMSDQTSWFTSDGVHVTFDGARGVARWLSGQVLFTQNPTFAPDNWVPYAAR